MLKQLSIYNFALIEKLSMEFDVGLNILTGETGAGKSIIIDAIGILIGGRASSDFIRENSEKAIVEGFFELSSDFLSSILTNLGLSFFEDGLILTREIARNGKNVCRINGKLVPLNVYHEIGKELIDIHGQNQEQSLLAASKQLLLLDGFGGQELLKQKEIVAQKYQELEETNKQLAELGDDLGKKDSQLDYLRFQQHEIQRADLKPEEEGDLVKEKGIIANAEKLGSALQQAYSLLYGGNKDFRPAYDLLSMVAHELESIKNFDEKLEKIKNRIENILYEVDDLAREINIYQQGVDYDEGRLDEIEQRLNIIRQLQKKYGGNYNNIMDNLRKINEAITRLENCAQQAEALELKKEILSREYLAECQKLRKHRLRAADALKGAIEETLQELDLGSSQFAVEITEAGKLQAAGLDYIEFYFGSNLGEGLKPLAKIASGGEVSRIMLAFKSVLAEADDIPTLIFDEIDTGVGGKAIMDLGNKLAKLGRHHQVICVTHAPQVASFSDVHFYIYKEFVEGRTVTKIKKLDGQERVTELARMLGGMEHMESTLLHAQDMLNYAVKEKCV